jgi:N-acyl-phosphatidylethanolamine-hydrolysing phospholipase D
MSPRIIPPARRSRRHALTIVLSAVLGLGLVGAAGSLPAERETLRGVVESRPSDSPRTRTVYRNQDPHFTRGPFMSRLHTLATGMTWLVAEHRVAALPAALPDLERLRSGRGAPSVTWVGHATVLVQLDGVTFLTDPNWSQVAGPFGVIGVNRYTPPGIRFEDLPRIDFVLISHDHYDHLDEGTVKRLAQTFNPRFLVPRGIGAWLRDRDITNVEELDWGERTRVKGLTVVCTPAQHGSGRTLADQGRRLWSSWAVLGSKRFYFGGDTGYYEHFRETGNALGPFDLAALPIGSYTPRATSRAVHMNPEEALQAWQDLRAQEFLGIHWGTFALAREPYDEPPARIAAEVARRGLPAERIWVPKPGLTLDW